MYFEEASFTVKSTLKGLMVICLPPPILSADITFGWMIGNNPQPLIVQAGLLAIT